MTHPLISVIVTAYNRRQYLVRALRSVHEQQLPAEEYEVLISKNFRDREIDGLARDLGFQLIDSGLGTAGAQIERALQSASGRVIALLDDDDTWMPLRLVHVARSFQAIPELQYYANSHLPINESGLVDYGKRRDSPAYYRTISDGSIHLVNSAEISFRAVDNLFRTNPGNNSSIAVARDLLENHKAHLGRIRTSIDHFLLVAGLLADGVLKFEHLPLTVWQRHASNTSRIDASSFRSFRIQFREVVDRIRADNRVLLEMAAGVEAMPVRRLLEEKIAALDELWEILRRDGSRSRVSKEGLEAIKSWLTQADGGYWESVRIRANVARAISPSLAEVALYLYLQKELPD